MKEDTNGKCSGMIQTEHSNIRLYTSAEVARILNRSRSTITKQAPEHATVMLGDRWYWTAANIAAYRTKMRNVKPRRK